MTRENIEVIGPAPQNGWDEEAAPPPAPRVIDLSPLLHDLNQQIEEGEQEARVVQMKLARLRGMRDGVLLAVERANQAGRPEPPPVVTNGVEEREARP